MRKMKNFLSALLCFLMVFQMVGCHRNEEQDDKKSGEYMIQIQNAYDGSTVDLCHKAVREYLSATSESEQIKILSTYNGQNMAFQPLTFSWRGDGVSKAYTVYFADNKDFKDPLVYETVGSTRITMMGSFLPGTTYYWKVLGDAEGSTSAVDTFTTLDAPVRYISTTSIPNVRDMGGWKTEDGKQVKYGLLYRGGKTNQHGGNECAIQDKDLFLNKLGVKTEIDLRTPKEDDDNQTMSVFGDSILYCKAPFTTTCYIFPQFEQTLPVPRKYDSRTTSSFKQTFKLLSDEKNYPIFFHCNAGADRTGTLAFLINGLLGVSYADLTKDFELTTFSNCGARWRSSVTGDKFDASGVFQDDNENYVAWGKMHDIMLKDYGTGDGKLSSAIENYLKTECDIKQEQIDSIRNIMLED